MDDFRIDEIIKRALEEDIGYRDLTTENLIPEDHRSRGMILAKQDGVIAGLEVARRTFTLLDAGVSFTQLVNDGDRVKSGDRLVELVGNTRALLMGERVALNFLQRMSGIATRTYRLKELIRGEKAEIVDTRKTTPGLRILEKYAVRAGGARNHRFGLFDGVMIKDNHIRAAGGISQAVKAVRQRIPHTIKIEVEVEDLDMLREALEAGADIILLDNMDVTTMKRAVEMTAGRALLEASGGINEHNLVEVARTGVDYISIGALTHSSPALDLSLELVTDAGCRA
ncbi:MAG: carboxylating nicotinate-nucleotide diphosphorylase [Syntrophomonadaceae bacterium]|nr:carboxylating nicotinate-nucleotide diphosphorylase [Syntrophomonadaceae bacterium]